MHGEPADYGLAHIGGQPVVVLGLALLAAGLMRLPPALRQLLLMGLAVDYALGIHLHVQLLTGTFGVTGSGDARRVSIASGLGSFPLGNFMIKHDQGLVFLADHVTSWQPVLELMMVLCALTLILYVFRQARQRVTRR
jgi:cyanate permease